MNRHSQNNNSTTNDSNRLGLLGALTTMALALLVFVGIASANNVPAALDVPQALPQARANITNATQVPSPVSTRNPPVAVLTTAPGVPAAPQPVATGGTNATRPPRVPQTQTPGVPANGNTSNQPSDVAPNPNVNTGAATGATGAATQAKSSSFPWLALLVAAILLALIGLTAMMVRRRSALVLAGPTVPGATTERVTSARIIPTAPAVTTATKATDTSTINPTTATDATTTTTSVIPTGPMTVTAAPFISTATATATATTAQAAMLDSLPATLTCPNCGATNEWSENFCHECGQDLRPQRAQTTAAAATATAPPPDVMTDDMPYLETLDRTDEQLEYVLSRPYVVIGSAAGNDIVIDAAFKGHETVSPRHAELKRSDDGHFTLLDLNSEQGTFINDSRTEADQLAEGDNIRLGSVKFIYRVP